MTGFGIREPKSNRKSTIIVLMSGALIETSARAILKETALKTLIGAKQQAGTF